MASRILVTGFEPFADEGVNPSWSAAQRLAEQWADGDLAIERLPVVFAQSGPALLSAVDRHHPDVVVCVGEAGGRTRVTPELVAVNWDDARIPDNAGDRPRRRRIRAEGPDGYLTGLPVYEAVERMRAQGIPAAVSTTAGTYVCNHVFYLVRDLAAHASRPIATGFAHVPYAPGQVTARDLPSVTIDEDARALRILVEATLEHVGPEATRVGR